MQSGRVDEHLDNTYKALQKLCEAFLLQFLTFLAARFCYILPNKGEGLDLQADTLLSWGLSYYLKHMVRASDMKTLANEIKF